MSRIGIGFSGGPNASEIVECMQFAESLGYESAWAAEGHGGDQFAILSAAAAATTEIRLGTAISSVYVRTAPTLAMAAATVDQLSGGRFVLGLGSSHKVQVEPEHGVPYGKPITRTRETIELIRALLRDGEARCLGETIRIENFDLWFQPLRAELPIYTAAVFEKMIEVTGELADGIILTRSSTETAARVRRHLAEGAARVGRDASKIEVTTLLPTAVADDRAEALDLMRPGLALYAGFFPRYNRLLAEHGFEAEAVAIAEAWSRGNRADAIRAVSDAMVQATSVAGRPEECRERIEEYRASGIDLPIISPFARGTGAKATFDAAIRGCAPR